MHVNSMFDILETEADKLLVEAGKEDEIVATGVEVEEGKVLSVVEDEIVATGMEADVEIEDSEVLWHDLLWLPRAWEVDIFLPQDWHSY